MPSQGTTTARGYGVQHQRTRAEWAPIVARGGVACWRCRRPIPARGPWHLGHDDNDRTIYRGPEHVRCNTGTAAARGNRARARRAQPRTRRSRILLVIDDW